MSSLATGIFCLIVCGMLWVPVGITTGIISKNDFSIKLFNVIGKMVSIVLCLMYLVCSGGLSEINLPDFWKVAGVTIGSGIGNFFQLYCMGKAMKNGPNGIIWSLLQSAFVWSFLFGVIFYGDKTSVWNVSGCAIAFIAVIMLGFMQNNANKNGNWLLMTIFAYIGTLISFIGTSLSAYFPGSAQISPLWKSIFCWFGITIVGIFVSIFELRNDLKKRRLIEEKLQGTNIKVPGDDLLSSWCKQLRNKCFILCVLFCGICTIASMAFFLFPGLTALSKANAVSIAYPIAVASCIIAFGLYARIWLREKFSVAQIIALLSLVLGIIALGF